MHQRYHIYIAATIHSANVLTLFFNHVSYGNNYGLAFIHPPYRVCRLRRQMKIKDENEIIYKNSPKGLDIPIKIFNFAAEYKILHNGKQDTA